MASHRMNCSAIFSGKTLVIPHPARTTAIFGCVNDIDRCMLHLCHLLTVCKVAISIGIHIHVMIHDF